MKVSQADLSSGPIGVLHFSQEKVAFPLVLQQRYNLYSIYQLLVYTASKFTKNLDLQNMNLEMVPLWCIILQPNKIKSSEWTI